MRSLAVLKKVEYSIDQVARFREWEEEDGAKEKREEV
jgi:hypothetical protein